VDDLAASARRHEASLADSVAFGRAVGFVIDPQREVR
jgi:hypothetical protein